MLTAILIFIFTLVLVIWQPRGLGIGWSASLGAVIALSESITPRWALASVAILGGIFLVLASRSQIPKPARI